MADFRFAAPLEPAGRFPLTKMKYIEDDNGKTLPEALREIEVEIDDSNQRIGTKANRLDVDILETRLDNIIAHPEGTINPESELADIRVGADGTVYESAGTAVREQVSAVSDTVTNISDDIWKNVGRDFKYESASSARNVIEYIDISNMSNIVLRFSGVSRSATVYITTARSINSEDRIQTVSQLQPDTLYNVSIDDPQPTMYAALYINDERSSFTLKYDLFEGVLAEASTKLKTISNEFNAVEKQVNEIYKNFGEKRLYPDADEPRDIINYRVIPEEPNNYTVKYTGTSRSATLYFSRARTINSDDRVYMATIYPDVEYKISKDEMAGATYCALRITNVAESFTLDFNIESGVICDVKEDIAETANTISKRIDTISADIGEVRTYDFTTRTSPVDVTNYRALPETHTDTIVKYTGIEMSATIYFTKARTINSVDRVYVISNASPNVEYVVPKELFEEATYCVLGIKSVPHGAVYTLDFSVKCGEISNIHNDIAELKANGLADLPEHMVDYMDEKDKAIDAKMNTLLTGDAFVFITDNHVQRNTLNSFKCTKDIFKNTSLDKVFFNGDCVAAYGDGDTIDWCAKINRDQFNSLKPYGMVFLGRGNHDFAIRTEEGSDTGVTRDNKYAYNMLTKCQESYAHTYPGKCYYYYDNTNQKIRYIGVDTQEKLLSPTTPWGVKYEVSEEQIRWLCDTALAVEDGWSVVVIGHVPIDTKMNAYDSAMANLSTILQAYKNKTNCAFKDFRNAKGEFVAYFTGHNHVDESFVTNGVLSISTTSDAQYSDGGYDRSTGTTNEVAFDVMVIDTQNRTIDALRIGAGNDRHWTY